jgi:hypothetical protein
VARKEFPFLAKEDNKERVFIAKRFTAFTAIIQ